jgi:hypothetical protein
MPSVNDFTPNQVWGSSPSWDLPVELTTPLGQTLLAKKVSIEGLLEMGILTMADSLTPLMEQHTKKRMSNGPSGPAKAEVDMNNLMSDPAAMKSIMTLVDKIMPVVVLSPRVALHYKEVTVGKTMVTKMIPAEERDSALVYTDQIDFMDKMFIFEWAVGGLAAMTSFREGSTTDVGGVVPRAIKPKTTKRRSASR